jgi:LmbE family N-acetylglucosaminyl deacetylase
VNRILVIAPHPDDEAIGCGGTLHRHAENGDDLWTIFLTSGENGRRGAAKEETARIREAEARIAAAILGISHVDFWREPDGALSANPRVVSRLRALVRDWKPAVVYVPHQDEMHVDHRAAFRIVRAAVGPRSRGSAVSRTSRNT